MPPRENGIGIHAVPEIVLLVVSFEVGVLQKLFSSSGILGADWNAAEGEGGNEQEEFGDSHPEFISPIPQGVKHALDAEPPPLDFLWGWVADADGSLHPPRKARSAQAVCI